MKKKLPHFPRDESTFRNGASPEDPNARNRLPSFTYIQGPPETVTVAEAFRINLLISNPDDNKNKQQQRLGSGESGESGSSSGEERAIDIRSTVLEGETEVTELENLEGLPLMSNGDGGNFLIEDVRIPAGTSGLVPGRLYTLQAEVEVDGYSGVWYARRTFMLGRRLTNVTYEREGGMNGDGNNGINGRVNGS